MAHNDTTAFLETFMEDLADIQALIGAAKNGLTDPGVDSTAFRLLAMAHAKFDSLYNAVDVAAIGRLEAPTLAV